MADYSQLVVVVFILSFETLFCLVIGFFGKYGSSALPLNRGNSDGGQDSNPDFHNLSLTAVAGVSVTTDSMSYHLFMDVTVMIFVGFGFVVTFLKKYGYSALGFSFLISVLVIQLELLLRGVYDSIDGKIIINLGNFILGEVAAATVLISFGAVIGKISVCQLIFMGVAETLFYDLNVYINGDLLEGVDPGGSIYVHVFSTYFGLAVTFVLGRKVPESNNGLNKSSYQSDLFSLIGVIFLWVCWPSFLAALQTSDCMWRTLYNTYLALLASCAVTFALSALFNKDKEWKFEMAHIQNGTVAGGVGVGTVCNMMIEPWGAILVGMVSALACIVGLKYLQDYCRRKLRLDDVCGIQNLHGLPGLAGGLLGVLMAGVATKGVYGSSLSKVFPARGPTTYRGAGTQAIVQLAIIGVTLGISIFGGLITGLFIAYILKPLPPEKHYSDDAYYNTPES